MTQAHDILNALENAGDWQTISSLQKALGIARHVIRGRLHDLIEDGKVERKGEGRKSKFRAKPIAVTA